MVLKKLNAIDLNNRLQAIKWNFFQIMSIY